MRRSPEALLLLITCALAACGPAEPGSAGNEGGEEAGGLALLAIDATPTLEIGQLEGDANYTLDNVVGVLTLASGDIAVADQGASEIRIYSSEGVFARRVGRKGEGPGEFIYLRGVYHGGGDSIRAGNGRQVQLLTFDGAGEYTGQVRASDITGDSLLPLDSWLYNRFWVEGALLPADRDRVRATLDRLPAPTATPGFRRVRVAEGGALWIEEPLQSVSAPRTWTIADASGTPVYTIDLPSRFEPYEIRSGSITGRWLGEADVHYVRRYSVAPTEERRAAPAWLTVSAAPTAPTGATGPAEPPTTSDEAFRLSIIQGIKRMAGQQEMYYSRHRTYTTAIDSLDWERPEGMEVHFVNGDSRGWTAVFTHADLERICALTYGFNEPAGWPGGYVLCAPEASTQTAP